MYTRLAGPSAPARNILALLGITLAFACGDVGSDVSKEYEPSVSGQGERIRDVVAPGKRSGQSVNITGAIVTMVDNFDETRNGARGDVYVQDFQNPGKNSGMGIFSPSFVPASLRIAPGDVVDLRGTYLELAGFPGATPFPAGQVKIQMDKPVATFRFDAPSPEPVDIDVTDLTDYSKGKQWQGLLVRVKNVTTPSPPVVEGGRLALALGSGVTAAIVSNEFADLQAADLPAGTTYKSITGIVTYAFKLRLAPRSLADFVR